MLFRSVASEARKVFDRYDMLGYYINVINTLEKLENDRLKYTGGTKDEWKEIPIPFKLIGMRH